MAEDPLLPGYKPLYWMLFGGIDGSDLASLTGISVDLLASQVLFFYKQDGDNNDGDDDIYGDECPVIASDLATYQQILHFLLMLTLHSPLVVRVEKGLMLFMLLFRNSPLTLRIIFIGISHKTFIPLWYKVYIRTRR